MTTMARLGGWAGRLWGPLSQPAPSSTARQRGVLAALLVAAFLLRLGIAWRLPSINHADEVYQVAEQANRAVNGFGIVPWEFRTESRAVILPTLVEPIYRLPIGAAGHRLLQAALFCGLSVLTVWVAFGWGRRLYGTPGAVIAASLMAVWFELVYFAPRATADAVCSYLLLAAVYLARPSAPPATAFWAGVSLALTWAVRVQVTPAVLLVGALGLASAGRSRRLLLLAGAAAGLAMAASIEWAWWGVPLQGQIGYLLMEARHHSSEYFAQRPAVFYAKQYILMYGMALPVVLLLIFCGAKRAPVLLLVALTVILPFQAIGHKEYRFIVAATPLLVLLMGLGAAALVARVPGPPARTVGLTIAGFVFAMLAVSYGDTYRPLWTRFGNHVLAFETVGRQPDACGIALVGIRWWQTPGYSGLGRDVPIYEMRDWTEASRVFAAANYVLQATKAPPPPPPYEPYRAYTRPVQFLYRRPGGCVLDPGDVVRLPPGIPGVEEP